MHFIKNLLKYNRSNLRKIMQNVVPKKIQNPHHGGTFITAPSPFQIFHFDRQTSTPHPFWIYKKILSNPDNLCKAFYIA